MGENKYYDTQPEGYEEADYIENVYEDPTHLPEIDKEITDGVKDSISLKLATWIRQKVFGVDVRETIARFILWVSVLYNRILALANKLMVRQEQIEKEFDELQDSFNRVTSANTGDLEVIRARKSNHSKKTYSTLGDRLDSMEDSHFTYHYDYSDSVMTILDNLFSANHELLKDGTVTTNNDMPGLIIATIDDTEQDTFYFEKVGEI